MKKQMARKGAPLLILLALFGSKGFAADLELYATFENMGVICTLDAGDDPDEDAVASVSYRESGGSYRSGFGLSRISSESFVGSLFGLTAGTAYDVRVSLSDPDGGLLDGVVLNGTMSTRAEISIPDARSTYVASPGGSGTGCSEAAPCSLAQAISIAQAGDEVLLRGGIFFEGDFSMPRSGTQNAPIVIRAYPGEDPVLDGADPSSYSWGLYSGGVYRTSQASDGVHYILADGFRLFPYTGLSSLVALDRDNTPGFYQDSAWLYVHLSNDDNPNSADMVVSRYGTAFLVEQDHIYFQGLTFKHYGQGSYPKVFYLNNASDCLIQDCTFACNDLGIGIKRDSHRNVIQDNEFYDVIFDWPWSDIKAVGGLEDGGIVFYDPVDGRGNVIRRNIFHDDFDGFGACPSSTDAVTNETDVYDNVVYRMGDDGVEADGRCSNIRIIGNTFHDILMGISLAPVYDGPVYAIRNLICRTGVGNNDYTGSPFKFNSGYDLSGPIYLFHNTGDAFYSGNNGLYIKAPGTWTNIYARNNIWRGTSFGIYNYNASQPTDLDYDASWNDHAEDLVRWDGIRYETLAMFSSAVGQETNGVEADPMFVDRSGGDFSLSSQSELIDAGVSIPGINDDYSGLGPDIGALEFTHYPPLAVTGGVGDMTDVSDTSVSVTILGEVNPNGLETTCYFEYGQSESYGSQTPPASAGAGDDPVSLDADIDDLSPGVTYHYRLVAQNAEGTTYGDDKTLVTDIVYVEPEKDCGGLEPCFDLFAEAMDAALSGGWIKVASGTYNQILEIDEPVQVVPGYASDFSAMAAGAVELAK